MKILLNRKINQLKELAAQLSLGPYDAAAFRLFWQRADASVEIGRAIVLTVKEVAKELGLRESTIRAWILRRKLTFVRVGGHAVRIPESEVERIIQEGTVPARGSNCISMKSVRDNQKNYERKIAA